MNEYVNAIYNQRNPNALKELLEKKKKDLDEALLTVITDMDMATDEKNKMLEMLLKAGANPSQMKKQYRESLLSYTIYEMQEDITKLLINYGANVNVGDGKGITPLHRAAKKGPKVTQIVLDAGGDPNKCNKIGTPPLFYALSAKKWKTAEILLKVTDLSIVNKKLQNAMHYLIQHFRRPVGPKALKWLIKAGVDLEAKIVADTPLTNAIFFGEVDAVRILVDAGCDVNVELSNGSTPLNMAAETAMFDISMPSMYSGAQMTKILIRAGADPDGTTLKRVTPLERAVFAHNIYAVRELIDANCNGRIRRCERERCIVDFMDISNRGDAKDCATFVLGDCPTFDDQLYYYSLPFSKEIGLCLPPVSLARLCRIAVRSTLPKGPPFLDAVDQLPLPPLLRDFVTLRPV